MLKTAVFVCWNGLQGIRILYTVCEVNHTQGAVHALLYICCEIRKKCGGGGLKALRGAGEHVKNYEKANKNAEKLGKNGVTTG